MNQTQRTQLKSKPCLGSKLRLLVTTFALLLGFVTVQSFAGGVTDITDLEASEARAAQQKMSYESILRKLEAFTANSKNVKLSSLGLNDMGEEIPLIQIGRGKDIQLVVAGQHGNEYGAVHFGLKLIASLIKKPLKNKTVYVIPVLNVSGYKMDSREEIRPYTKHQVLTNDSNRDFFGPCSDPKYTGKLKSTDLLVNFIMQKKPHALINLHTHGEIISYPWGSEMGLVSHDDLTFNKVARKAQVFNDYTVGLFQDLDFGGYTTRGNLIDWAYEKLGVWSFLIELGPRTEGHRPKPSTLNKTALNTIPAIRSILKNAPLKRSNNSEYIGDCTGYSKELQLVNSAVMKP